MRRRDASECQREQAYAGNRVCRPIVEYSAHGCGPRSDILDFDDQIDARIRFPKYAKLAGGRTLSENLWTPGFRFYHVVKHRLTNWSRLPVDF